MKYKELNESISFETEVILKHWTKGLPTATQIMKPEVVEDLAQTVNNSQYTLYRGFKFHDKDEFLDKMKKPFEKIKKGMSFNINSSTPQSWTTNIEQGKKFSTPSWNSMAHEPFTDDDYDDAEIFEGDLIGIGMLVQCTFEPSMILADLNNAPRWALAYSTKENEVIVKPGKYKVKILNIIEEKRPIQEHEPSEHEIDLDRINKEQEQELQDIKKTQQLLPQLIKRCGYDPTKKEDVLKCITDFNDEMMMMAFLVIYGKQYPEIVEYIKTHGPYPTHLKHLRLSMMMGMFERF
jgi:hypothetical protein